ncbi:MAG: hypothetical protein WBW41_04895 [Verrucomicrobiia bacterium]
MVVWTQRFNLYLALAAALALLCGCQTHRQKGPLGALRVHIQVNPDSLGISQTVSVLRSDPVLVTIARNPILTEANLVAAKVLDTPGGFAIEVQFDENGTWLLEQYSAANPGGHFAIWSQWSENDFSPFSVDDIINLPSLASKLKQPADAVSQYLKNQLSAATLEILTSYQGTNSGSIPLQAALVEDLNRIIRGHLIYDKQRFAGVVLRRKTQQLLAQNSERNSPLRLNRLLLEDAYPLELSRNRKKVADSRWLAAPLITRRIANGVLAFTPDCSRAEADQLVLGLNQVAAKNRKGQMK